MKAQFIDSGFPWSQPTFNRLQGVATSCLEALGATRSGRISPRLPRRWGRVCSGHIFSHTSTKLKRTPGESAVTGIGAGLSIQHNCLPSDGKLIAIMNYLGRLRELIFLSLDNLVLLTAEGACQPAAITTQSTAPWLLGSRAFPTELPSCSTQPGERSLAAIHGKTDGREMIFWSFLTRFLSYAS